MVSPTNFAARAAAKVAAVSRGTFRKIVSLNWHTSSRTVMSIAIIVLLAFALECTHDAGAGKEFLAEPEPKDHECSDPKLVVDLCE